MRLLALGAAVVLELHPVATRALSRLRSSGRADDSWQKFEREFRAYAARDEKGTHRRAEA
jgi:hypothetical protein